MSFAEKTEKIAEPVTDGYKKIESGVVDGYKKIESGVVGGYKKMETGVVGTFNKVSDKFVEKLFARDGETVEEIVTDCIHVMGENTQLARVAVVDAQAVSAYIHGGGKIGVLVTFNVEGIDPASDAFQKCGRDIAMQVAALNPVSATREDVPADVAAHEMEIYKAQAAESGKPEAIQEKIALGRMDKFYKENCLAEQDFVKNPDLTVAQYADECAKEMGGKIAITGFVRFALGE